MLERRLYFHVDWAMLGAILALCLIGLVQIYSVTGGAAGSTLYVTQMYGIVLGLVALLICLTIDYRTLADKSHWIYLGLLLLLVYVLFFGVVRGGSRRWIDLQVFNLQPSEFAKATVALVLAKFFGDSRRGALTYTDLVIGACITAVPLLVIARQPDLGTAVTILPALMAVAFVAGMPMRIFGVLAIVAVLAAPVAWMFALQDYQKERISTFLDPEKDARGAGYQQIQARITTGSGGLWGKGFGNGTQAQQGFLPEAMLNYLTLLGWSSPDGEEVFMRDEAVAKFSLDRVNAAPAVFDPQKLDWLNGQYIHRMSGAELRPLVAPFFDAPWLEEGIELVKTSVTRLTQFGEALRFVTDYRAPEVDRSFAEAVAAALRATHDYKELVEKLKVATGLKGKSLFHPLRLILTGMESGPELVRAIPLLEHASTVDPAVLSPLQRVEACIR